MKKNSLKYFLLASVVFAGFNCDIERSSIGKYNEIIVIADDADWNATGLALKAVFEKELRTPQKEQFFYLKKPTLQFVDLLKKHRNLVLLSTLEFKGEIGKMISGMVTPDVRTAIENGESIFVKRNEFSNDQVVIFLIAPTTEILNEKLLDNKDMLFNLFDNHVNRSLELSMYEGLENEDLQDEIFEKYGFTFKIHQDFKVARDLEEENILWLRRFNPDRMVMVHWIDTTDVGVISPDWVKERRNIISTKFMDNTVINGDVYFSKQSEFISYIAVETRGLWIQPKSIVGGPMINYTFYDDETKRIYMIDLTLQAPDRFGTKEPLIRQLEVMARTFTTTRKLFP